MDFTPIQYKKPPPAKPETILPPYNGFGSEEDSLSSCKGVIIKPAHKHYRQFLVKDRYFVWKTISVFKTLYFCEGDKCYVGTSLFFQQNIQLIRLLRDRCMRLGQWHGTQIFCQLCKISLWRRQILLSFNPLPPSLCCLQWEFERNLSPGISQEFWMLQQTNTDLFYFLILTFFFFFF